MTGLPQIEEHGSIRRRTATTLAISLWSIASIVVAHEIDPIGEPSDALLGLREGTAFVDLSDPHHPFHRGRPGDAVLLARFSLDPGGLTPGVSEMCLAGTLGGERFVACTAVPATPGG